MDAERYQGHPNGRPSLDERVELDGEVIGSGPVEFRVVPQALDVAVPATQPR